MAGVKESLLIDVGAFKGLDVWSGAPYVKKENATDLLNVVPDRKLGSYNTVRGRVALNTPGTIGATLGLKKFPRQGASTVYIQAANTVSVSPTQMSLYQFPYSGGAVSQLTFPSGVTWAANQPAAAVIYQKWMFWTNGNDRPLKVDFNLAVTRWQADAPTNAPSFIATVAAAPSLAASVGTAPGLTPAASGGSLATATYFYVITAVNSLGIETGKSPEASTAVTGPNGMVTVSWTASAGAASYRIYRGTATGAENVYYTASTNSFVDTGAANTSGTPPAAGTLAAATYFYEITELGATPETGPSPEASVATLGTASSVAVGWLVNGNPTSYRIYRGTATTAENVYYTSTVTNLLDTGAANTSGTPPAVTTGNLSSGTNFYYYRITFGNADLETSPGPVSLALTITNGQVTLSGVQTSSDTQITQRNVYRVGGTWAVWKLVGTINDNTTTTFSDNVKDTALGQLLTIFRDPPQSFFYTEKHKERIFGFGTTAAPSDLAYSNFKEPWGWNFADQVIPIETNVAGDTAQGLASTGSVLVLFKAFTTHILYGDSKQDFLPRKLFDIGCIAPRSITKALGLVFWLAKQGAFMFDGAKPSRISSKIKSVLDALSVTDLNRATGFFRDQVWYLSFVAQGVTYAYDLVLEDWFKLGWAAEIADFDASASDTAASRSASGQVDSWFAAETDLGGSITAAWQSKVEDSEKPQAAKRYRYIVVLAPIQTGQTASVTLTADPGTGQRLETRVVDLGAPPTRKLISLPPTLVGFQGQLLLATVSTAAVEVQKMQAYGWVEKEFVPR